MTTSFSGVGNSNDFYDGFFTSGNSQKSTSSNASAIGDSTNFNSQLTISQIRDGVDALALDGKLTGFQQMHLMVAGFEDDNPADPGAQSAQTEGYARSTPGTLDLVATLNSYAEFDAASGNSKGYDWTSLANTLNQYSTNSSLDVKV